MKLLLNAVAALADIGLRHKLGHRLHVTSVDMAGARSYRNATCLRCDKEYQQHLTWGGKPDGPWRLNERPACTHSSSGARLMACMRCALEREQAGLR